MSLHMRRRWALCLWTFHVRLPFSARGGDSSDAYCPAISYVFPCVCSVVSNSLKLDGRIRRCVGYLYTDVTRSNLSLRGWWQWDHLPGVPLVCAAGHRCGCDTTLPCVFDLSTPCSRYPYSSFSFVVAGESHRTLPEGGRPKFTQEQLALVLAASGRARTPTVWFCNVRH